MDAAAAGSERAKAGPVITGHVPALDGLRGFAVLAVVVYHSTATLPLRGITILGWMGVDLFFVLSGFLITGILLDMRGSPHYYKDFIARRALRIFPLYFGVLVVVFVLSTYLQDLRMHVPVGAQWHFWTYTQNFWFAFSGMPGRSGPDLLNHFWSLAIEEQFYLVWPWVVALMRPRGIALTAITGIMISVGIRWMTPAFPFAYTFTFSHLDGLLSGALAVLMLRYRSAMTLSYCFPVALVTTAVVIVWRFLGEPHFADLLFARYGIVIIAIMFAAWLLTVFSDRRIGRSVRGLFENRVLRWLGRYSYGIYVYHWILFVLLYPVGMRFLVDQGCSKSIAEILFLVGYYLLVAGVSYLSYSWYERPFLRAKRFFEHARPTHAATRDGS